jgi:hypothetical protein
MMRSTHLVSASALAALLLAVPGAFAQEPEKPAEAEHAGDHDPAAAPPATAAPGKTPQAGAESVANMDLEAIEAELDLLVTRMKESRGQSKIDAMADLLATLVRQQRAMCRSMHAEDGGTGSCCQAMHSDQHGPSH